MKGIESPEMNRTTMDDAALIHPTKKDWVRRISAAPSVNKFHTTGVQPKWIAQYYPPHSPPPGPENGVRIGLVYTWIELSRYPPARFRWIMPGTFTMGSPDTEAERDDDETQHEVTLTNGFWLADSACTQALWAAVMGNKPSHFQDDPNHPVENVSWLDVQQFIEKLNTLFPDLHANLPTEA